MIYRPGQYADVILSGPDVLLVRSDGALVVCELAPFTAVASGHADWTVQWSQDVSAYGSCMFVKVAQGPDGAVYAVGKAHQGHTGIIVSADRIVPVEIGHGNQPLEIAVNHGQVVVYSFLGHIVGLYDTAGTRIGAYPISATRIGSSQGIRFISDDGAPVLGDDTHATVIHDRLIHEWMQRGPWTIGQSRGIHYGVDVLGPGKFTCLRGPAYFPRFAVHDSRIVVLKIDNGVMLEGFQPPYPTVLDPASAPSPPPVSPPEPTPPPPKPPDPGPPMPTIPDALRDQLALVTEVRNTLFPDKVGKPLHDPEKAALWAKHLAWRLRHHGVGLARAKPGSANRGGATPQYPEGFTTDIVCLANGVHWDFQIDGHDGAAFPTWALEENPENYPPIASRFVPAFDPGGTPPQPEPDKPPLPPPSPDPTLEQRISALAAVLSQTRQTVDAQAEILAQHTGLIADLQSLVREDRSSARMGDPVYVRGTLLGRSVVLRGKIGTPPAGMSEEK